MKAGLGAHQAAKDGTLPDDFDGWGWTDNKGRTVINIYEEYRPLWSS
jgi:hypothetical protein